MVRSIASQPGLSRVEREQPAHRAEARRGRRDQRRGLKVCPLPQALQGVGPHAPAIKHAPYAAREGALAGKRVWRSARRRRRCQPHRPAAAKCGGLGGPIKHHGLPLGSVPPSVLDVSIGKALGRPPRVEACRPYSGRRFTSAEAA
jgi:hypothetical protein